MNFINKKNSILNYKIITSNLNINKKNEIFKFSVIIPIYNNGAIFANKCFKSLKQSSMFEEIEIIVVDDESNDNDTRDILKLIETKYNNVKVFLSTNGNSGSPSTPRNTGLEMSSCEYITYLDPDNEAINDGYKKLYDNILNGQYDIVIGNIAISENNKKSIRNYYYKFKSVNNNNDESYNGKEVLLKTNFMAQSIQATMIKKSFIQNFNLKMVDKALGEDTLFFYELMLNSKKIKVINEIIHVYNKDQPNSLTNNVGELFFQKYLILEENKIFTLKKHNVLDSYLNTTYEKYFKEWYLEKFKNVSIEQKNACSKILKEIYSIYENKWIIKDEILKQYFETYSFKNLNQFKFTIIVAIYNNGEYLKNRCIESLKKSTIFDDIEILLVDDGSSDEYTINIIKELKNKYKNIKTYFFQDGGSGSPSRPRNKGIELSTTNYITYLDPDNEAVDDGYKTLYDNIKNSDVDLVIGNIKFVNNTGENINDYYNVYLSKNNNELDNGKAILYKTGFMAQSIQGLLVKKSILIDNNLKMIDGAIGEDTLFFYQLLTYSKNVKVVKDIIHKYYTNREDSITNSINLAYFEKHLLLEKEKRKFLEKEDLIDGYLKNKQSYNFKVWIIGKLRYCKRTDYLKAQHIIDEIYTIYKDIWIIEDKALLNYFLKRQVYLKTTTNTINE